MVSVKFFVYLFHSFNQSLNSIIFIVQAYLLPLTLIQTDISLTPRYAMRNPQVPDHCHQVERTLVEKKHFLLFKNSSQLLINNKNKNYKKENYNIDKDKATTEIIIKNDSQSTNTNIHPTITSISSSVNELKCAFEGSISPPNWHSPIWSLDPNNSDNNGYMNQHFKTWMRSAPFPSFRKLWGLVDHNMEGLNGSFSKQLHDGDYVITIEYSKC